jgi:DNA-binding transcriptional ArsR family regulator
MLIWEYNSGMARAATTADPFNAIGAPARRELLDVLSEGEATVGQLVARLGLSQPQVSKHLGVLRAVELVAVSSDGKNRRYRVNGARLKPIHDWVARFEGAWNARLDRLDDLVANLGLGEAPHRTSVEEEDQP